jgi:transcriptional regulator with XRE-family HTH domain
MSPNNSQQEKRLSPLKDLRDELGLTQEELAALSGIKMSRLPKLEQGKRNGLYPAEVAGLLKLLIERGKDPVQWFADWAENQKMSA